MTSNTINATPHLHYPFAELLAFETAVAFDAAAPGPLELPDGIAETASTLLLPKVRPNDSAKPKKGFKRRNHQHNAIFFVLTIPGIPVIL